MASWHILAGEFPPQRGGVSDYTLDLAAALSALGQVTVWCPRLTARTNIPAAGIKLRELDNGFNPAGLREIAEAHEPARILLLQYAPNAFGYRGMNLPLCFWALNRSFLHREDVRVMFHEPFFYFARQSVRRNLLALTQRVMALLLMHATRIAYVSTSSWIPILRPYGRSAAQPSTPLPIPSTVKPVEDPTAVLQIRRNLTSQGASKIVGHFGTYGDNQRSAISRILTTILQKEPKAAALCLGGNGDAFAEVLVKAQPSLSGRIIGPGYLDPISTSLFIQSCDLFVQPYPDGVTTRRTTLMAILSHAVASVTTRGSLTEDIWLDPLSPPNFRPEDEEGIASIAAALLADSNLCNQIGSNGKQLYDREFSMEITLRRLQQNPA